MQCLPRGAFHVMLSVTFLVVTACGENPLANGRPQAGASARSGAQTSTAGGSSGSLTVKDRQMQDCLRLTGGDALTAADDSAKVFDAGAESPAPGVTTGGQPCEPAVQAPGGLPPGSEELPPPEGGKQAFPPAGPGNEPLPPRGPGKAPCVPKAGKKGGKHWGGTMARRVQNSVPRRPKVPEQAASLARRAFGLEDREAFCFVPLGLA